MNVCSTDKCKFITDKCNTDLCADKYASLFTVNGCSTFPVGVYWIKLHNKESKKYKRLLFV